MKPGDVLYLPRGQYHDAITGAGASLHVTFWVKPASGLSLFKLLESAVTSESEFRAFLPDARDAAALRERLARLSTRLERLMNSPAFATEIRNHQRSLATYPADFELPIQTRPKFYSTAKPGQVIRRDDGFAAIFDKMEIALGDTYPAVAWLTRQRVFSFDDVVARHPFVDERELRAVLERLLAIGAIVETEMR
jgi:ribosomal protein L16 Arg81 hydroxylase